MKTLFYILTILLLFSCEEKNEKNKHSFQNESETVKKEPSKEEKAANEIVKTISKKNHSIANDFIIDINSLTEVKNPIQSLIVSCNETASKKMSFNKENIADLLKEIDKHTTTTIIVENHTVLNVKNTKGCKPSGSWGACMPIGEGFIKKGALIYQKDYINNIIGRPDNQERMAYFF